MQAQRSNSSYWNALTKPSKPAQASKRPERRATLVGVNNIDSKNQQQLTRLSDSIDGPSLLSARQIIQAMHPAEIADALESVPPQRRKNLWELVSTDIEGEVLMEVGEEVRQSLVREMDIDELRLATEQLDLDDLADFYQSLPEKLTADLLAGMGRQDRARLEQVLSYPEDSAGGLMNLDIITVRGDVTVDVVLRYLRRRGELPINTDRLWVIDFYGQYQGALSLRKLLTSSGGTLVSEVMRTDIEALNVLTSEHDVAHLFEDFDLVSAPVVDDNNRLIGRVTVDDVVDVIREEAEQSMLSMAGLNQEVDTFSPVLTSARRRALWLGVNLLTALLAAWVVAQFEATLDQVITLAVLMSVVPSMGGIAGSQTLTLVIRAQALGQINSSNTRSLLLRELAVGLINGMTWALIVSVLTYLWFGSTQIGLILGIALLINVLFAAAAGLLIPLTLRKLGIDPAIAGGVVLTTVTDVIGLVAFLGLATLLLL